MSYTFDLDLDLRPSFNWRASLSSDNSCLYNFFTPKEKNGLFQYCMWTIQNFEFGDFLLILLLNSKHSIYVFKQHRLDQMASV